MKKFNNSIVVDGVEVVNLTPHAINVFGEDGVEKYVIQPENGLVPRCAQENKVVSTVGGVPIYQCVFGEVENLPEETQGVILVVSRMVVSAAPNRGDLVSPGPMVRGEDGRPKGCIGFSR